MSAIVYRICALLGQVLCDVPVGTNLGLFSVLFALLSGRFLAARGAVFPALSDLGLEKEAVCRAVAALAYGRFQTALLLFAWQQVVVREGIWQEHRYEGIRPVPGDLIGFFRPHLGGCLSKHYTSQADRALPAVVLGVVGSVGSVQGQRLALPRLLLRPEAGDTTDAALERRLVQRIAPLLEKDEALVVDAGFALCELLACGISGFVARQAKNFTARRNGLPAYKGKGRRPEYGERVRPLSRRYKKKRLAATAPDHTYRWKVGERWVRAQVFEGLVLTEAKPGAPSFRCVVIDDPRYHEPLVLATNLSVSASALYGLYHDRWPIEQLPLAAKQMLGAERAFVSGAQSRYRLPELALLAGSVLSYVAATSSPVATGFWDRCCRPTCGRLRRLLCRVHFSDLPLPGGQMRKKNSVTTHLPKGVEAHRRTKSPIMPHWGSKAARFTGN
jgi:hypothetical protein